MCCCFIFPLSLKDYIYTCTHIQNVPCLFSALLGLGCCVGFSLTADSGGCFLAVVRRLLPVESSLAENALQALGLQELWCWDQYLLFLGSGAQAQQHRLGFALWRVRSSQTRDSAHVSYNVRWVFHHQITREALQSIVMNKISFNLGQIISISFYVLFFFLDIV